MLMSPIFLSYRRADAPGYVGRLADSLERLFGEGTVFRDVDSLRGGDNWKKALSRAVSGAELLIAVIGPRWQADLLSRESPEADWVRFELNQANNLDIPVIPLVLGDAPYTPGEQLGNLAWLADIQGAQLADGQRRWDSDVAHLAQLIQRHSDLELLAQSAENTSALSQVSHGKQSPNIDSGGGDVTIGFGADPDEV